MKNGKNKLMNVLLNEDFGFQQRLLNVILTVGCSAGVIALIYSVLRGFNLFGNILIAVAVLIGIICLIISLKLKHPTLAALILTIILNDIVMPVMFVYAGGIQSGMPVWYTFCLVLPFLLLNGIPSRISFILSLLGFLGTLLFTYFFPERIVYMTKPIDIIFDVGMAMFIVICNLGFIIKYQKTVHNQQQEKILDSMKKIKEATVAKTVFLTNVTHDIRTPMNAIIGYTEIAKRNSENKNKLYDCLSKISVSSEHLLSLVNDVLEMSRIESGKLVIQYETESLHNIITNVLSIVNHELEEKNIDFNLDLSDLRDDMVVCDTLRVKQVLLNILSNAIKYSKQDGKIYLSILQTDTNVQDVIKCEFHIKDEGCGISDEFKERLFTPFERERNSTVSGVVGSGLGLAISKNLVEMMGGTINVISEIGKGAEFIVKLNFEVPSLAEIKEDSKIENFEFNGKKILVVEDNDANREIVCEILNDAGFEVDQARDGLFAIEKVQQEAADYYCAILMDIQMPGKDGYETTKIIRSFNKPGIERLPILALSANVFEEDKQKALDCGMNGYITKPFNINDLLKLLNYVTQE